MTFLMLFIIALCVEGRPVSPVSHVTHAKVALVDQYTDLEASESEVPHEASAFHYKLTAPDQGDYIDPGPNVRRPPPPPY